MSSPFTKIPPAKWVAENELAFAIRDGFPVSPGHTLVITKRVVPTWFEATADEQAALMQLVNEIRTRLDAALSPKPDGYNVGFNCGDAAGQTVPHVHVHVIPRYRGDMADPRGGVRHVIPSKGNYLLKDAAEGDNRAEPEVILTTGHPHSPLWEHLAWRIAGARQIDILSSFVQLSGLDVIEERLFDALRNDATVRILVSDYLYISDVRALRRLYGWTVTVSEQAGNSRLLVRLIECERIPTRPASFHPKAWYIAGDTGAIISVGSSNLSGPALQSGIEWNLLSAQDSAPLAHRKMKEEFADLWQMSSPLTLSLIDAYAEHATTYRRDHFQPEAEDAREPIFEPRPWQVEALRSLQRIRNAGYGRALVAVATGMGKTWLAAFDVRQAGRNLGRRPRILVIAHRAHILAQAEAALTRVLDSEFGDGTTAWYLGGSSDLSGDLVVASVQKLSRGNGLKELESQRFDYVVVDEVHHAHAPSYRKVLARLNTGFILGLTATPERADGYDVATIFDDNLAYHATIGDGIAEESLVPFHYIGLRDTVDFTQVPWRNGRFDLEELERRVAQSERMERLATELDDHPAGRTIVFCCSQRHALFTRNWLRTRGYSAAAVYSGADTDSYSEALNNLRAGKLEFLCVVDMFNEGLDIPAVDRVVMLRPTESKVVFLQQLGRGLRASEGKSRLLVIDFVGNHRVFAQRMIHLLSLASTVAGWKELRRWLNGAPPDLPEGCLLDVELDARDLLKQFLPKGKSAGIEGYRALRDELGRRPTMTEVFSRGYLPKTISAGEGGWFAFVASEGDLPDSDERVAREYADWLRTVETTSLNKSFKMVVLRVLLDQDALFDGVNLTKFASACRHFLLKHPVLKRDLEGPKQAVDHQNASDADWTEWWIKWPISRWLDEQNGRKWFVRSGDNFELNLDCGPESRATFENLTEEIVEYRLAHYARSRRLVESEPGEKAFEAKVSHANGRAMLFVPEKSKNPDRPVGLTSVVLPDKNEWDFKFVKVACNVAHPKGETTNQLSDLLRSWYGPKAGLPGTNFSVRFETRDGVWHLLPASELVREPQIEEAADIEEVAIVPTVKRSEQYTTHVPVYDVSAAAGDWGPEGSPEVVGWVPASDHRLSEDMFAARVIGHSMEPRIRSGSWCLFRPCPAGSREGRLVLVQANTHLDPVEGGRYTVKRYHSVKKESADGWEHHAIELQPLNPDFEPIPIHPEDADSVRIIGEFVAIL
ncbi:DEAD/DEAH box helicase family protein [Maioricimonas sp. JC845]|uniref:DEAD/DEAH box helicase family protein n=1 Tax=Maioricimonas sp. JC845 TaxID=3232138 RepID=UPI0034597276